MDVRLSRALKRWDLSDPHPLSGDAGARRYVRVHHPELGKALLVIHPEVDEAYFEFRALHAYLDPLIPVPVILQACDEDRVMLVEDLGDETLERRLSEHPTEEMAWAQKVGALLAACAGPLTEAAPPKSFFMARSFDRAKFDFEWSFCKNHFFEGFLGKPAPLWLDRLMEDIHASLAPRAHFFAHRDFHVRNLMVQGRRLVVLDFQDARRGAATYDLASVRFDSYWDWSPQAGTLIVEALRQELRWEEEQLWEELVLSGIQRNLKALGTFAYQLLQFHRAHFAPSIPRALRHLEGHFQRLHHGEGYMAAKHWRKQAEDRLHGGGA